MAVNESVYGSKASWIPVSLNSTTKYANFGDNTSTIQKGFQTGKLKPNKAYNSSIVHSSLGNESAISRFKTYKGNVELSSESFNSLMWNFACGTSVFQPVDNASTNNTTNMLTPITNSYISNSNINPIVDFSYKNVRAVIRVYARKSENGQTIDRSLHEYCENYSEEYPYITKVYLDMYDKIGNTWRSMSTYGYLGILIHNETNYFSHTHAPSKTFTSGIIGNNIGVNYGSGANVPEITILGLLSQRLGGNRIYTTDINIVTGDLVVTTDADGRGIFHIDYYDGFEEYCMHQAACFGIQFVTHSQYINVDIESEEVTEEELENVYIGVLDDNFIGHGDFVNGEKIKKTKQYELDSANDSPFDPSKETDPNAYHNKSVRPSDVNGNTSFTTKYVMNYGQLDAVANDFYNALNTKPEDLSYQDYSASLFLTNNAIDTIISCKRFPFNVPSTSGQNVKLGNYTIKGSDGQPLVCATTSKKVVCFEFDCGVCFPEFNDFRDYAPYTVYTLKIPYCSSVQLNTAECVGQPISVTLAVDIETGDCTGFVYADGKLIDSVSGNCAVDVAISGIQQATLDSQIFNASINQRQAKTNTAFAVAKSVINVGANAYGLTKAKKSPTAMVQGISHLASSITSSAQDIVNSAYEQKRTGYEISHVQIPFKCVGGVSGGICLSETQNCVLIKESPVMLSEYNESIYGKTVGFACLINDNLSNYTGLTVCSDIDLSGFTATEREKEMIRGYANGGFKL